MQDGPVAQLRLSARGDKLRVSATLNSPNGQDSLARIVTLPKAGVGAEPQEVTLALRKFEQAILDHLANLTRPEPSSAPQAANSGKGSA
jgi:hypothetical protein